MYWLKTFHKMYCFFCFSRFICMILFMSFLCRMFHPRNVCLVLSVDILSFGTCQLKTLSIAFIFFVKFFNFLIPLFFFPTKIIAINSSSCVVWNKNYVAEKQPWPKERIFHSMVGKCSGSGQTDWAESWPVCPEEEWENTYTSICVLETTYAVYTDSSVSASDTLDFSLIASLISILGLLF